MLILYARRPIRTPAPPAAKRFFRQPVMASLSSDLMILPHQIAALEDPYATRSSLDSTTYRPSAVPHGPLLRRLVERRTIGICELSIMFPLLIGSEESTLDTCKLRGEWRVEHQDLSCLYSSSRSRFVGKHPIRIHLGQPLLNSKTRIT